MAPFNTEPIPHNLKGTRYHFPPVLTILCETEGSALLLLLCCPKHRNSTISFSVQTSSFKSQNRERMENRTKPTTCPWFVIVTWKTKKKKKAQKKVDEWSWEQQPPPMCTLHCHLPQPVLYSNQRIFWASQNAINPHWEWNRAHLHRSLYSSNHCCMLAWTGSSYRQRWVLKIK